MAGEVSLPAPPGATAQSAASGRPPWLRPHEVSSVVQALASLGLDFPPAGAGEATWESFQTAAFRVPGALVVLGAFAALILPLLLCFCPAFARSPKGAKGSPGWTGFATVACLTGICLIAGLCACLNLGVLSLARVGKELRQATAEIWKAKRYTTALNASGVAVLEDLALMYEACPQDAQDYLGNSVSSIEGSVRRYNEVARNLSGTIISLPHRLVDAQEAGLSMGGFYSWNMALPSLLLVAICCGVIAAAVVIQEKAGPKVAKRFERCHMPFVSLVCVAPVMVLLSTAASGELAFGIELAAFCSDADAITLQYAAQEFGNNSDGFNMTRYYLTGEGSNEALTTLGVAGDDIRSAIDWMRNYRPIIERTCPAWQPWNVTVNLQTLLVSLNETQHLLAPSQVYGHYRSVVHSFACGASLSGLGFVVASQVLLAILLLPALSCCAGCLLKGLSAERELGHRFDLLPQDEDTDLESSRARRGRR